MNFWCFVPPLASPSAATIVGLLLVACADAQDVKGHNPYGQSFDDFAWTEPLNLRPLMGAVRVGEPIDTSAAIAIVSRRIDGQPEDYANRTLLGQLLLQHAKQADDLAAYVDSEDMLRSALKINPAHQPAKLALAMTLMARHEFSEASELTKRLNDESPNRPATLAVLFDTYLELGDYVKAQSTIDDLQRLENSAPVLARAARIYELRGERIKAIALIEEAIDSLRHNSLAADDELGWYQWRKATLQLDSGNAQAAEHTLRVALESDPNDEAALVCLATAQFALGNLTAATKTLECAAAGQAPPVLALFGDALALQGEKSRAETLWNRTEALMREEAKLAKVAHAREVALFYADHGRNLVEALHLSELDMAQRTDAQAWDTRAWVLFKNGHTESARNAMQTALSMVAPDNRMLFHAAMIELSTGDVRAAKDLVQKIDDANSRFSITYFEEFQQLKNQLDLQP